MLLARTVKHLRLSQVVHRVRLRGQRMVTAALPTKVEPLLTRSVPARGSWPVAFTPLDGREARGFPDAKANAEGEFCFLAETRRIGNDWQQAGASQLWRYHLHYFEWAWPFVAHEDRQAFASLWRSWRAGAPFGQGDAWSPYVVSLRAWSLCGLFEPLVRGTDIEDDFLSSLRTHAGFVRANLELDVGGNHLLKNVKALIGLGVFFGNERMVQGGLKRLERELAVQVLADGGHYERSPSYHCQVLGDLIDIRDLLAAAGRPSPPNLDDAAAAMQGWLGVMLLPDGDVPLFNDCTRVGRDRLALLEPTAPPPARLAVLPDSGYVVVRPDDRLHLVADVGPPCPPDLPAHAHADCLSFELAVDGERVVVDTGTSTYQDAARRAYERSTRAHNTVEVDGVDQTEVWGAFRAARRATPRLEATDDDGSTIVVVASHDGYERLPGRPRHRRTWRLGAGAVRIVDDIVGDGVHRAVARLHVAREGALVIEGSQDFVVGAAEAAEAFGVRTPVSVLAMETIGELPLCLSVDFQVADMHPGKDRR